MIKLVYNIPALIELMEDDNVKNIKLSDNFFKANEPLLSNGFSHKYAYIGSRFQDKDIIIGINYTKITYYYGDENGKMKSISKKCQIEKQYH